MDPAQLNLTTKILGFGRFLFVDLHGPYIDSSLLKAIEDAGAQRANPQRLRKGELADDDVARSVVLVRLEGSVTDPLLAYERRLRAAIEECAEP